MISVIIPLYNREHSIARAIESVLHQTFQDFELIVVDDCSTDKGFEIVEAYGDPRIRLLKHSENSGAAAARNTGIKAAKFDYIALLDSDDYYENIFLESSYKIIENTSDAIGFMWSGRRILEGTSKIDEIWIPNRKTTVYETFLNELKIGSGGGLVFKKSVFYKCGFFDENLPAAEDTEFFLRISKVFDYAINENIAINIVKGSNDRISKNFAKIAEAYNIFLPQYFTTIEKNRFLSRKFFYKMMWLNYYLKDKKAARNYFYKLLKSFNLNIKIVIIFLVFEILPLKVASKIHQRN